MARNSSAVLFFTLFPAMRPDLMRTTCLCRFMATGMVDRLNSGEPPGFRENMLNLFHPHVPMEVEDVERNSCVVYALCILHFKHQVIEMFKPGYCGLCCIKFSGDKFCWKHYTGKGHAGLLQRKSYRFEDSRVSTSPLYDRPTGIALCPGR